MSFSEGPNFKLPLNPTFLLNNSFVLLTLKDKKKFVCFFRGVGIGITIMMMFVNVYFIILMTWPMHFMFARWFSVTRFYYNGP